MLRLALWFALGGWLQTVAATNAAGEAFLAQKATEQGVVLLPSGLMCAPPSQYAQTNSLLSLVVAVSLQQTEATVSCRIQGAHSLGS